MSRRTTKQPSFADVAGATRAKIIGLFSIDNNYDQPNNNLVAFWTEKPSIQALASALRSAFPASDDAVTLAIVKIWGGEEHDIGSVSYRLQDVTEGEILE
ncbi:MAG TPA: hypothetical protein P5256_06435 [Beijerinckiaceae bacterium]|nr:hypothetical protein [Rhodoblastus sp.]MCC2106148.1 hypothetical protein [Hyphomicrobiales bacterium]MCO5089185.1 hypothetical protein [Methylobacteriaceae bacterium]HPG04751.1 hypothetical protein [Rhodoblastus sp.]HRY02741.1 hypothetical protein [Beijerinckiaceae bacterium]